MHPYGARLPTTIGRVDERSFGAIRSLGVGAFAGVFAGALVGGLGGRLAMRVSGHLTSGGTSITTANGNQLGEITFAGTLALVIFSGIVPGVLAGVLYALLSPSLGRAGRSRGFVFGTGLLAVAGPLAIEPFNFDFEVFGFLWLNVLMFAAIFVLVGVVLAPLYDLVERNSRGASSMGEVQLLSLVVWLSVIPAVLVLAILSVISITNFTTLVRNGALSDGDVATVVVGAATFMAIAVAVTRERPRVAPLAYVAFVAVIAWAAVRTLTAIAQTLA